MSRTRALLLMLAALCLAAAAPSTAGAADPEAPVAAAAAKKRCKKGYRPVVKRVAGRKRTVCRKKPKAVSRPPAAQKPPLGDAPAAPSGPAGPSVAEIESIIRGQLQAGAPYPLGAEAVEVVFERPTEVRPSVMYNPYEADPLTATGEIPAWPVRAWVRSVTHRDATPEDDTTYGGCLGHLNSFWPYDSLYMFFRGQSGEWTFLTSTAKPGDCP